MIGESRRWRETETTGNEPTSLSGNNGDGSKGGGIYECTPNSGNWETTGAVTCSLVVLDQALNDRNDGLTCLPAMTGDNPFTQFTD